VASPTDVELLRRHSLWLARLTLVLLLATALLIALPPIALGAGRDVSPPVIWGIMLRWSPSLFYLYSLWAIRQGFREFAIGGVLGPAIATGCSRAGIALAIGAALSSVGVPNLSRTLAQTGLIHPTEGMFQGVLVFDTAYLAVGVVGLALMLLGRLLRRASEIQAEAASLRSELDEFF
jgi:hypothetical protein